MGGRWPYSCSFVDLFSKAYSILVQFPFSFFLYTLSQCPCGAWKKLCFILSDKSDFQMIDNLSIAVYVFASHILISFSIDEMLLSRYVNLSFSFKEPLFRVEMSFDFMTLQEGIISEVMTNLINTRQKVTIQSNYRPITCLPVTRKILTA